jgi:hypothetical protein
MEANSKSSTNLLDFFKLFFSKNPLVATISLALCILCPAVFSKYMLVISYTSFPEWANQILRMVFSFCISYSFLSVLFNTLNKMFPQLRTFYRKFQFLKRLDIGEKEIISKLWFSKPSYSAKLPIDQSTSALRNKLLIVIEEEKHYRLGQSDEFHYSHYLDNTTLLILKFDFLLRMHICKNHNHFKTINKMLDMQRAAITKNSETNVKNNYLQFKKKIK